jgi:cell division protein FtsW (lipid II flippase)
LEQSHIFDLLFAKKFLIFSWDFEIGGRVSDKNETDKFSFCENYPKHITTIRWIILLLAFGLGIYVLLGLHYLLAIIYIVYSLVALTLILPLSRCASCFYHGKFCNTGWGKIAAYLSEKGDESKYVDHYNYAIFLHLLWLIPLLIALLQLVRQKDLFALSIFVIYLFILFAEKIILKKLCCKRCHQREFCPAVPFRKME